MQTITATTLNDFLSAFYPDPEETIRLRAFKPKKVPESFANKPVKIETTRNKLLSNMSLRAQLKELNLNRGLYFVVNSGGHSAEEITRINAFFAESDTQTIEQQNAALDEAPIAASIRIETKNSVHAYWLLSGDCGKDDWRDMQERLIAHFGGDDKIKDPSRVMRLPYFNHLSVNGGLEFHKQRVGLIVFEPARRYSLEDMQAAFKPVKRKEAAKIEADHEGLYPTWDALNQAAKSRILSLPTCKFNGRWAHARGVCHDGQGDSGLFINLVTGAYGCFKCDTEAILSALGLPIRPDRSERPPVQRQSAGQFHNSNASEIEVDEFESVSALEQEKPEGIIDLQDVQADLDWLYQTGLQAGTDPGWPSLEKLYTVKRGQFTVVTGTPGAGKSAFLDALVINLARDHNWKFAVASFENQPVSQYISTFLEIYTGEPFTDGWTPRMSENTKAEGEKWISDHFSFLLPKDGDKTVHGLLNRADWLHKHRQIDGLLLDPWNEIDHRRLPGMTETEYANLELSLIRNFARERKIHIWLVAHPKTINRDKSGNYPTPTLYDISGSAHFKNKADFGIVVSRDASDGANPSIVEIQKVRFRWCGKIGSCELYFDSVNGRFSETPISNGYRKYKEETVKRAF